MPWVKEEKPDLSAIDPGAVAAAQNAQQFNPDAPRIEIGGRSGRWVREEPERTMPQELARQGGLTIRHAVEGAAMPLAMLGDAANAAVNMGIEGFNSATGKNVPRLGSVTDAISGNLDQVGIPKPATPTERVVGEASKMMASVPTMAMGALATGSRALRPLAEGIGQQITSAGVGGGAYGAAKEAFPESPSIQAIAALGGGYAGALRAAENPETARRTADFVRSGVQPALQDVSQSQTWQRISKLLEAVPFTSDTMKAREIARLRQAEESAARLTERLGTPGSPQRIGEEAQQGVENYRFRQAGGRSERQIMTRPTRDSSISAKADVLYNRVPIRPDAQVDGANTMAALQQAATRYSTPEMNALFETPLVRNLTENVSRTGGQMTWQDMRNLRTDLRRRQSRAALDPTVDDRVLGQINDALTLDMAQNARNIGGDRAVQAVQRADSYYAQAMQATTERLKSIFNSNKPEQVYAQIESAISSKPNKSDINKLIQLRKALPREAWDDIAATIVDGLGRPTSAGALPADMPQFSTANFVRKYGEMSDQAKTLLFDGAGRGDLRGALDALYRTAGSMKNTDRLANVSQSGNQIINFGTAGAAFVDPVSTLTALGAANLTARALYNPTFIRLMTTTLRANNPAKMGNAAVQISEFARENPDLANDAAVLLQNLAPVRAEQNQQTKQGNMR